jgi:hypothetical protein
MNAANATISWLDYLSALEQAIAVMSLELEALEFQDSWSPEHKTKGLQNLQQLRQAWIQNRIHVEALEHLQAMSTSAPLQANLNFQASLEAIERWSHELREASFQPYN